MEAEPIELSLATENMMAVYMIAYELHDGEDYENLITGIKELPSGGSWHRRTWGFRTRLVNLAVLGTGRVLIVVAGLNLRVADFM
jgi:hypothetical protein